ncbi:NADP-dependent succinic semialdehyde dehydrogenase OS=Streptomyces cyaneofuscatus OX=66883 GN=G3I52_01415 PE=4 SV=1 [Streptomyces cyaneofuscatus]
MPIATVNPANGELIRSFDALGEEETERRITAAAETFRQYRASPPSSSARPG